ncbi:protein mab-21-like 3 isoform X2 [Callorhinchus milii]|uniref:Mab-21-like 3 n=1 Tax=Callorhinchus milii TaxID=7868 RepID=A0A4W3H9G1_CALMI|nr:protein mab-21-like 3 isoform X2 [Callorhinchus milii]|eukprot:gi/632948781/ref/XP_007889790.1/ PREDICTED: protein mab-21-like 3 isoform X2 [Callorhinchus milii]
MPHFTEEDLDHYLQNQVDLRRRQVSKIEEEVYKIVQELTSAISAKDGRFQSISHSGINNDNMKVEAPSQFVIMVPLRGLAGYTERKARQWRYYTLHGSKLISPVREPEKLHQWLEVDQFLKSTQEWHQSDVTFEGDIVPAKVVAIFKELLENTIQASNFQGKISILENVSPFVRIAVETTEQQIEAELVPAIEIPNYWPSKAHWPRFLKRWPLKDKARCVKSFGFNLLAKSNYHWQLSFTRAELVLLDELDEDGGCRMKCLQVIRKLKEDFWCPGSKPVITSYHLQTLLFWSCEKYSRSKDWRNFRKCFLRLVKKLQKCVLQRYLRHYFVTSFNLLKYTNTNELDMMSQKLSEFLTNPSTYLH